MMLWLMQEHHIPPGEFWRLPEGEKAILAGMYEIVMEGRKRET